jgi:hypothetical protein
VWAFHNIDKVLATQTVTKSTNPSTLESEPKSLDAFKLQYRQSPTLDLNSWLEYDRTDGLIILHKGKIVHEYYANGNQADSKHIVMSMFVKCPVPSMSIQH